MEENQFSRRAVDGVTVVIAGGDIDIASVHRFKAFLENSADPDGAGLVLDMTSVSYLDSRAIATLAEFSSRVRVARQRLALVADENGIAAKLLYITGLAAVIPIFSGLAPAVEEIRRT